MKILVDENIPLITVYEQSLKGFDVIDIRGSAEQGITDDVLWLPKKILKKYVLRIKACCKELN